ncbi:hypothetical protein Pint_11991 [Pistacia integerrima]|uniref:Uncharacterized protein n=1 Tax=Pistacia integerrima TaxID=434235 RepID=A0ACC0XLW7_9ROSI|nr:hypothetical protein Pint_11991 [Pistacia integerrima]
MAKGNTNALALAIPIFTGENYDVWSIKMKTYFLSQDLWDIVNYENYLEITGSTLSEEYQKQLKESKKNDAAALFILRQAVDDNIFRKISRAQKAKEAWDALKEEFTGIPQTISLAVGTEPEDFKKYMRLYKAILEGDLIYVRSLCDEDENARITVNLDSSSCSCWDRRGKSYCGVSTGSDVNASTVSEK